MTVEKTVVNSKKVSSEVTQWTHQPQYQYDVQKMSLHGEKFWRSYPQKTLESSIGIQFRWWYSPRQKKQIDGGEKAPVERSEAKVKLRFDTIIKIGRKCHTKRLEKIVWIEHNICFASITTITYSLLWAQKRLAWRRETTSIALPTDGNCSIYSITPLGSQVQGKTTQTMNRSSKMQLSRKKIPKDSPEELTNRQKISNAAKTSLEHNRSKTTSNYKPRQL